MWLTIYGVNSHSSAEWMETCYLLYVCTNMCICLHVCGCMHMCLYMIKMLCTWMACGSLGYYSSEMSIWVGFFSFFETGALTGLELTKLSWLRSQQEVQIHMSSPSSTRTIVYETSSGRFPYHGFLGLASVPHALPSVLKAFQIGTILFKEKKPPCMPTASARRLHSHPSSTGIVLGIARDSRHL